MIFRAKDNIYGYDGQVIIQEGSLLTFKEIINEKLVLVSDSKLVEHVVPLDMLVEEEPSTFPKYSEGEAVLYQNGDNFELGIVKRVCGCDEYFINYHTGDTAARTHARHLHKIRNKYAFHIIRLDPDDNERR